MEKIFALVKDNVVENCIVASQEFIDNYDGGYEYMIRIDEMDPRPGIGWTYDGQDFSNPE